MLPFNWAHNNGIIKKYNACGYVLCTDWTFEGKDTYHYGKYDRN